MLNLTNLSKRVFNFEESKKMFVKTIFGSLDRVTQE